MASAVSLPPDHLRAVDLFNRGRYLPAQKLWLKLSEERPAEYGFFYGLLTYSSGIAVLLTARTGLGSRRLFELSAQHLQAFRPWHLGIDVDHVLKVLARLEELSHSLAAKLPKDYDPLDHEPGTAWPGAPDLAGIVPGVALTIEYT